MADFYTIQEMMKLQGDIRVHFMRYEPDDEKSYTLALEAMDLFLKSNLVQEKYRDAYRELSSKSERP